MAFVEPNDGDNKGENNKVLSFDSLLQDNRNLLKGIMKKYIVFALSLTLLLPTTSFSAVKKPASKAVVKKPVVKKPVAKKVAVKPTPTPSPSTVVEAPKVVEPTPTPKPAPTTPVQPITFENLDFIWTSKVARTEIITEFAKLNKPENAYEMFTGPTVTSEGIVEEKRLLDIATTMFSSYYLPKKNQVVYFSERDANWAEETKTKIGAAYHTTFQAAIDSYNRGYGCNFAFATKGKDSIPVFFSCLDSKFARGIHDKQTAIHEYFHLVQAKYEFKKMPCWMLEGSATYFGATLGIDGTDPTGKSSFEFIWQLARNPDTPKLVENVKSDVAILDMFKLLDKNAFELGMTSCTSLGAYTIGSVATEALIAVKGYKTYMDFVTTFSNTSDWKAEFKKAYGLSTDDFYLKLAPYLRYRISN